MRIIGIDCWDVIFRSWLTTPLPNAFSSLRKLVLSNHFNEVFIVSKVSFIGKYIVLFNFWRLNFYNYTGISKKNVYFCRHNRDKAIICEELGITDFIDDRLEVLNYMGSVDHLYALNPRKEEFKKYPDITKKITIVKSWNEIISLLLSD